MNSQQEHPNPIDLSEILDGLEGKWIILSEDKKHVLKSANSLSELAENIHEGLVMRVPYSTASYSPATIDTDSTIY